jgi:aspartyl-tRNA(Asn)/glutamyl-tRNA(Gln) amidotransferase subunit C
VEIEEVCRVAGLANLELTAEEIPGMQRDLNAILGYVDQLNELDTTGVEPLTQIGELVASSTASAPDDALRADQPRPSLDRALVMREAPETDGAFFKVPKVIER